MPVGTKDMITKGMVVLHVAPCPCPVVTTGMVTGGYGNQGVVTKGMVTKGTVDPHPLKLH